MIDRQLVKGFYFEVDIFGSIPKIIDPGVFH